ncbi:MAG: hypothetical protein ABSG53_20990 [Thermoguttaceae bacterium]|jgi:hypothetical protein
MASDPEFLFFPTGRCLGMRNEIITFNGLLDLGGNRAIFTTSLDELMAWLHRRWSTRTIKRHLRLLEASGTVVLAWLPLGKLRVHLPHLG